MVSNFKGSQSGDINPRQEAGHALRSQDGHVKIQKQDPCAFMTSFADRDHKRKAIQPEHSEAINRDTIRQI